MRFVDTVPDLCLGISQSEMPLETHLRRGCTTLAKWILLTTIRWRFRRSIVHAFDDLSPLTTNVTTDPSFFKRSKTGTYSFRVTESGQSYKLYTTLNHEWAHNVVQVSTLLSNHGVNIPRIIDVNGSCILAEWLSGSDIRGALGTKWGTLHQSVVEYQAQIHGIDLSTSLVPRLSYIDAFLMPRFARSARFWLTDRQFSQISEIVRRGQNDRNHQQPRISHPDITHFNLIASPLGLAVIDNETLHSSSLWEYDILNTANIVFAPLGLKERYLAEYARHHDITSLYDFSEFWEVVWLIRMAGGKFQVGRTQEGKAYLATLMQRICC